MKTISLKSTYFLVCYISRISKSRATGLALESCCCFASYPKGIVMVWLTGGESKAFNLCRVVYTLRVTEVISHGSLVYLAVLWESLRVTWIKVWTGVWPGKGCQDPFPSSRIYCLSPAALDLALQVIPRPGWLFSSVLEVWIQPSQQTPFATKDIQAEQYDLWK